MLSPKPTFYAHRLDDKAAGEALGIAEELGDERLRVETMAFIAMQQDTVGELAEAKQNLDEVIRIARRFEYSMNARERFCWRLFISLRTYGMDLYSFRRSSSWG
ncbi:MAG TPA: hypothetical protein VFB14_17285 [Bryobacteraceae bacterium]|jgi:hypothetical protein|nr:hypothetical protein [Bryobacteraceae bacterium]